MEDLTTKRYTAHVPGGATRSGTASEIAAWLQSQDWEFGKAGQRGAQDWREAVLRRLTIQTGQNVDTAQISGDDAAFLEVLASAGLLELKTEN